MNVMEEAVLLEKYRHLVRAVAWSVSPEAARDEDALQSGFIGLWEAARRWDGRRPFEPLARRCSRWNIVDYLRGREDFEGLTDDLPEDNSMAERQAEDSAFRALLIRLFPRRSLERKVALLLLAGKTKSEVARRLHVSRVTVYRVTRRIWRRLEQEKEGQGL